MLFLQNTGTLYSQLHTFFTELQHGFRKGVSTVTQLITIHELAAGIDNSTQTDVTFLDFSKGFDRVPYKEQICKLTATGIHSSIVTWISSHLTSKIESSLLKYNVNFLKFYM